MSGTSAWRNSSPNSGGRSSAGFFLSTCCSSPRGLSSLAFIRSVSDPSVISWCLYWRSNFLLGSTAVLHSGWRVLARVLILGRAGVGPRTPSVFSTRLCPLSSPGHHWRSTRRGPGLLGSSRPRWTCTPATACLGLVHRAGCFICDCRVGVPQLLLRLSRCRRLFSNRLGNSAFTEVLQPDIPFCLLVFVFIHHFLGNLSFELSETEPMHEFHSFHCMDAYGIDFRLKNSSGIGVYFFVLKLLFDIEEDLLNSLQNLFTKRVVLLGCKLRHGQRKVTKQLTCFL
mmetsp:Transcript_2145/g.4913  ORF Transcript_2145/g.4913 Transcript_2145/m.4913 type:complete len:284 (-) Transcript_2145:269-1120(-)